MPVAPDWRRLYWEARERAEAAEERAETLKRAELDARCDAGSRRLPQDVSQRSEAIRFGQSQNAPILAIGVKPA